MNHKTNKWMTIRIDLPEGYEDVHPELALSDFLETPKDLSWNPSIVLIGTENE